MLSTIEYIPFLLRQRTVEVRLKSAPGEGRTSSEVNIQFAGWFTASLSSVVLQLDATRSSPTAMLGGDVKRTVKKWNSDL